MKERRLAIDTRIESSKRKVFRYVGIPKSFEKKLKAKMEETRRKPNNLTAKQQRQLCTFGNYVLAAAILGWEHLKDMSPQEVLDALQGCP